jgi:hypothetical protein
LDSSLLNTSKGDSADLGAAQTDCSAVEPYSRKQSMDAIEAEFNEEVVAMESQIAHLGKNLHMNGGLSKEDAEAKALEEREAEKRRRDAELRKARLKEKAARDPKRKIQLKLENRRRFDMDSVDQSGIPTTSVTFQTHAGCEKMQLVDVKALRSKCKGLSEGIHSVPKLVELQQRKESCLAAVGLSNLKASSSMPGLVTR